MRIRYKVSEEHEVFEKDLGDIYIPDRLIKLIQEKNSQRLYFMISDRAFIQHLISRGWRKYLSLKEYWIMLDELYGEDRMEVLKKIIPEAVELVHTKLITKERFADWVYNYHHDKFKTQNLKVVLLLTLGLIDLEDDPIEKLEKDFLLESIEDRLVLK